MPYLKIVRQILLTAILFFLSENLFSQCIPANSGNIYSITIGTDGGPGSLRQAIDDANNDNVGGSIELFSAIDTFFINSPLPVVTCDSLLVLTNFNGIMDGQNSIADPGIIIAAPHSCVGGNVIPINFYPAIFSVSNTNDSGPGSLREAIIMSDFSSSADRIHFNIPGQAPHAIQLISALPYIHQPLTIDGSTQPANGYTGNAPKVELDGTTGSFIGLYFNYNYVYNYRLFNAAVYGLYIHNFTTAVYSVGSKQFICGDINKRNVISGNRDGGAFINDSSLIIRNNFIGTDTGGISALPNEYGLTIIGDSIGSCLIADNVISGDTTGILIYQTVKNFLVKGNLFGTDKTGSFAIPNIDYAINSSANNIIIGGTNPGDGNLFSGNGTALSCFGGATIKGNKFGTNLSGTDTIPNLGTAIYLSNAKNFQIGGPSISDGNIISASEFGIYAMISSGGKIQNNLVGTDISGTMLFGNKQQGMYIRVWSDSINILNNVIAGNQVGVYLEGSSDHDSLLNNNIHDNIFTGILNSGNNNLFSHNSIYDNGISGIYNNDDANDSISKPIITFCTPDSVVGTSLPNSTIELYYSHSLNNTSQGKDFISAVTADSLGYWKYAGVITDVLNVTAIQTDSINNTSEFADLWTQVAPDVWPGDCNYDLTVDNFDFLYLNIASGDTGSIRNGASINWIAQPAADWNLKFATGVNHKHADTNGDGTVNLTDTTAILQNYGLTHPFRLQQPAQQGISYDFYLVSNADTVAPGSTVIFEIYIGSATVPVESLYGIAYSVSFDQSLIDTSQMQISYSPSVLGIIHSDLESFEKDFYLSGQIDAALCRTNHTNDSNFYGLLGTVYLKIKSNISALSTLHIFPSQAGGLTFSENPVSFNLAGDSLVIDPAFVGINNIEWST